MHPEYIENLAVIAWHNNDEFEFPQGMVRDGFYGITGYPTVWFDGWQAVVGGYNPTSYPYYVPVMEERVPYPSNFEISMSAATVDGMHLEVEATIEIKNGNSTENLAAFVVLTETDIASPGNENQFFVARNVYPDGMGMSLDFSSETSHTFSTTVTIEDNYMIENCEVVVFIENMDTKEIYQGTSMMAVLLTGVGSIEVADDLQVYPNPANNRVNIKANNEINSVRVYNHVGQLVYETHGSSNIMNLNTEHFNPGMYIFKVQTNDGLFVESVIIE